MNPIYEQIEARYNFRLPREYCELHQLGRLNCNPHRPIPLDTEWIPAEEIPNYELSERVLPGFVPFAFTGSGSHWCWWTAGDNEQGMPVVMCGHDEDEATVDAPNFLGFLYRNALEYAREFDSDQKEDEERRRLELRDWCQNFSAFLPPLWAETLASLEKRPLIQWRSERRSEVGPLIQSQAHGLFTAEEYDFLVQRDLMFERFDEEIMWQKPYVPPN